MSRRHTVPEQSAHATPVGASYHDAETDSVFDLSDATVGGVEFVSGRAMILDGGRTLCFVFTDTSGVTTSDLPVPLEALANIRIGRTRPRLVFKVPFDVAEPFLNINNGFDDEDVAVLGEEGFVNICAFAEDIEAAQRFGSVMAPVLQREQSRRSAVRSSMVRRSATRAVSVSGVFGASLAREPPQPSASPFDGGFGVGAGATPTGLAHVSRALHLSPPTQQEQPIPDDDHDAADEASAHDGVADADLEKGEDPDDAPDQSNESYRAAASDAGVEGSKEDDVASCCDQEEAASVVSHDGDDGAEASDAAAEHGGDGGSDNADGDADDGGAAVAAMSPIRAARILAPADVRAEAPLDKSLRSMAREASLLVASQQGDFRLTRRRRRVTTATVAAEAGEPDLTSSPASPSSSSSSSDDGNGDDAAPAVAPHLNRGSCGITSLSQGAGDVRLSRRRPAGSAPLRPAAAFTADADVAAKLAHTAPRNTRRPVADDDDTSDDGAGKETLGSLLAARFGTRPSAQSSAAKRRAASTRFDTLMGGDVDDGDDIPMTASSSSAARTKKNSSSSSSSSSKAKTSSAAETKRKPATAGTAAGKKKPAPKKSPLAAAEGGAEDDDFDDIAAEVMKTTSGKKRTSVGASSKRSVATARSKKNPTSAGRTPYLSDAAAALRAAAAANSSAARVAVAPTPAAEDVTGRLRDPFDAPESDGGEGDVEEEIEYGGAEWTATTTTDAEADDAAATIDEAAHAARRLSFKLTPHGSNPGIAAVKGSAAAARSAMKSSAKSDAAAAKDEVFIESPPPDDAVEVASPEMPAAPPPSAAGESSTRRRSIGDVLGGATSLRASDAAVSSSSKKPSAHPPTAVTSPVTARASAKKKATGSASTRGSGEGKEGGKKAAAPDASEFLTDFASPSRPGLDGSSSVRRASGAGTRRAREAPSMAPDAASVEATLRDMLAPLSREVGGDDDDDEVGALAPMMALMVSKQLQRAHQKRSDETTRHAELAHALLEQLLDKFKRSRSEAFDRARTAVGGVTADFIELRGRMARLESDMEAALSRARTAETAIDDAERRLEEREDKTVDSAHSVLDRKLGLSPMALTSTRWRRHRNNNNTTAEASAS